MSTRNDDPEHACRPFDRSRDGFIMGEGACALVLERWDHAIARGAPIYGEVAGYACTNDAYHLAAPRPDGSQAARAMRIALHNAGLQPHDIDFVSPHGSSTPLNDTTETQAIKSVLGERAYHIPISATKPFHAHALGASGAMEAAICCLAMNRGWLPPTLNCDARDDDCDLDYVPNSGRAAARAPLFPTPSASAASTPRSSSGRLPSPIPTAPRPLAHSRAAAPSGRRSPTDVSGWARSGGGKTTRALLNWLRVRRVATGNLLAKIARDRRRTGSAHCRVQRRTT
jgi:hypothetical protein